MATRTESTVCESAGLSGRIPQDFRRTAVRNLERAGLSRSVAMRMTGYKSEAVYRQYAIVSEEDLHEAALKLARVEQQGKVLSKVSVVRE